MTKTRFQLLPEDLQNHISGYVDFRNVLELSQVCSNLKHVREHIKHITIKYTEIDVVKLCPMIKRVKTLILLRNQMGDEGMKHLALYLPKHLQILRLGGNQIGAEGMKHLAPHLPK